MKEKVCTVCGLSKTIDHFRKHHCCNGTIGRCKSCVKIYNSELFKKKSSDPNWLIKERARCRAKAKKYREENRVKPIPPEKKREYVLRAIQKNPEARMARMKLGNALRDKRLFKQPCEVCGSLTVQAHHDDYSKPLEVRWLCVQHHNEHHVKVRKTEISSTTNIPM